MNTSDVEWWKDLLHKLKTYPQGQRWYVWLLFYAVGLLCLIDLLDRFNQ